MPRRIQQLSRLKAAVSPRIADPAIDRVVRNQDERIREIQQLPGATLKPIHDVVLEDGSAKPIAHGLGRPARWVGVSCVRGASTAGVVTELRDGSHDRKHFVTLRADDYGSTITVDLLVL